MAIDDADPSLVVKWKSMGKWPLPCQMVFVLKPLTQSQQQGDDIQAEYKHKSRLVICGNFASWGEHSTNRTNLDAPLLRLMLREKGRKSSKLTLFPRGQDAILWTKRFYGHLGVSECTKIARFSAVAAAILTAPGRIARLFEASRCAISSAKKIASEPRFLLR